MTILKGKTQGPGSLKNPPLWGEDRKLLSLLTTQLGYLELTFDRIITFLCGNC